MKYHFDFNRNATKYFAISIAFFAIILVATIFMGVQLDIEFKGGTMITYAYEGQISFDEFEAKVEQLVDTDVSIQQTKDVTTELEQIMLSMPGAQSFTSDQMVQFSSDLQAAFPSNNLHSVQINNVDPTIGKEFLTKSLTALALAMVLMMLYVAIRFRKIGGLSAGAMGVVALVHDCIIVFGVFVIFRIPLDENFIAVILTILGFSLNDTIVIYDRIRENKRLYGAKMPIGEMVSKSINQSLTRSVNTSLCAIAAMIVVTVVASIHGVESIFSFSFPLILGLVSGSYSTICIAGPLWIKWQEHKLRKRAAA